MKKILTLLVLFLPFTSIAQVSNADAQYSSNGNILLNPSFENGKSSWTNTNGTFSVTTTSGEFSHLKSAGKIALTAQALAFSQSVTPVSGTTLQYTVGASYRVPSAVTDFQICTLIAGSEKTCVPSASLIADGLFHTIEIPEVITAGSSVGIKFKTTASYTQNIFIDNAYIRQGLGLAGIQLDNVYSAQVTTTSGVVTNTNRSGWVTCSATNPTVCTFASGLLSVAPNCTVSIEDHGGAYFTIITSPATSSSITVGTYTTADVPVASKPFSITCQKSGNDYLAASSSVYSQASANYSGRNDGVMTIGATTTPPTKGTIVTDRIMSSRDGNRLLAEYQYEVSTANSGGSGDLLFTLPQGLSFDSNIVMYTTDAIISATTSAKVAKSYIGIGSFGLSDGSGYHGICQLYAYDATRFRAWCTYENGNAGTGFSNSALFTTTIFAFKTGFNFKIDVPISGWSNAAQIVGSFAGVPTVPGYQGIVDTFSVSYGQSTLITPCTTANTLCGYIDNIGASSATVTKGASTGLYTLTVSKTYLKLRCLGSFQNGAADRGITPYSASASHTLSCNSCSSTTFTTGNQGTGALDSFGTIMCQGTY
jgi:hypothetical protein